MTVKSCEKVEKSQVALTIDVNAAEFEAAVERHIRRCAGRSVFLASVPERPPAR